MSHDLLRQWLQLSTSSWPPDHYTLLGLQPGEGATDEIEIRVLERMDLLRRYQLLHPEQVTEGMNRLAQAMNCLLDSDARRVYDARLPAPPPSLPVQQVDTNKKKAVFIAADVKKPAATTQLANPTIAAEAGSPRSNEASDDPQLQPPVEKFYALGDEPPQSERAPITPYQVEEEDEPLKIADIRDFEESFEEEISQTRRKSGRDNPETRRPLYAELARIRRVLRLWQQLRQYLIDPEKAFNRRTDTVGFMTCLNELKALLPTVTDLVGAPDQPGNLIAMLSRQTLVVEMFRSLLPSQRESLAQDCRSGHFRLSERYEEIRATLRRKTAKNLTRQLWIPMLRELGRSPEWLVLALGCAALLIALIRSLPET